MMMEEKREILRKSKDRRKGGVRNHLKWEVGREESRTSKRNRASTEILTKCGDPNRMLRYQQAESLISICSG
jgi:hypothetical protein